LNIPYRVEEVASVTNRYEAINFMIDLQLARRNLTPERKSYLRGRRYNEEKKAAHRPEKVGNGYPLSGDRTSAAIAREYGVSEKTIRLDATFAQAVDALPPTERTRVLSGNSPKPKKQLIRDHLIAIGQYKPPAEKRVELIYREDTQKALQMLKYHLQTGCWETRMEILTAVIRFLRGGLVQSTDVDRIWSQIKQENQKC